MNQVKVGDDAVFYTVTRNHKVEKFDIEIVGIVDELNMGKMLLFKVIDPDIILNGGISEGTSGSPVYQNDKYIGAIAYGIKDNSNYGLIMPVDFMEQRYEFEINDYTGKAIAVSPTRGDVSFDVIGTVTFSDGKDIFIYGHKLDNKGNMGYFIKESEIKEIVPTQNLPFKIGVSGKVIGLIEEDDKYGLRGKIGEKINFDRFNFTFSEEGKNTKSLYFDIVDNKKTKEVYLEKAIETLINKAYNHNGYKSAKYILKIFDKNGKIIYKDSDFIVGNDNIKISLANTIFNKIVQSTENKYSSLEYDRVDIKVDLFENEKIIYVNNVEILGNVFLLGDKLRIAFYCYVHQKNSIKIEEEIDIPLNFPLGPIELELIMDSSESDKKSTNMKDYLENLQNKTKNNELLVRFKDKFDKIVYTTKIKWDYYIIAEDNYNKEIVIDSFEASN
jgi:hypothetical protein